MSDEKPLPPEPQEPGEEESLEGQTEPRDPTPVEPPDVDVHDLPTLIDLEKNAEHDDEETDDIFPVGSQNQSPSSPRTLPGSGGLDPNPDFTAANPEGGQTVPHIVPFQHTMVHVPGEEHAPIQAPRPRPQVQPPQSQQTIPAPPAQPPARQMTQPAPYPRPQAQAPQVRQTPVLPRRQKPKPRRILGCSPGCLAVFLGVALTFCGGLTLAVILLSVTLGTKLDQQLQAQVAQIDNYTNFQSTFFYDRTGKLLYEAYNEGKRTNVAYSQFPQDLINATVAIEDNTFFTNPGFEIPATVRAFLQYVGLAQGSSGGSTITQQLVRDVLFSYEYRNERSIQRKAEEIMLALLLTQRKSKQDILALYLNEIYYGNRAYGAEAAAQTFFSKDVSQLTLGEAALLAGLPQAPADLDPLNPDPQVQQAVDARWRLVLDQMLKDHFITQQQHDDALKQGITYNPAQEPLQAPHFTVYAEQELDTLLQSLQVPDAQIQAGGFKVYTTVDLDIDNMAQQIAASQISALKANNASNAAVVVLQPITGEILAMVGSVDYNNDAIDGRVNVAISLRQPGSAMKPLTYSAAMEQGMTPGDIIWDTPVNIDGYQPVDYDRQWHGPVRMRTALANSYNVPAVQTLRRIGVPYFLNIAQRFGIQSLGTDASKYGLSLTLGGGDITLLELSRAYAAFANGGSLVPTTSILCVLDSKSNIIYQYENGCPSGKATPTTVNRNGYGKQVVDPRIAFIISDMLSDNVARTPEMGANSPLNTGSLHTSVKTGTTDDFRDNWTMGFTRNVQVGVWVGNSDGSPMVNTTGLTGAAPIWNQVMTRIYGDQNLLAQFAVNGQLQPDALPPPNGVSLKAICNIAALKDPATDCGSNTTNEWFLDSSAGIPDADGNLQFAPQPQPTPNNPPASGPWVQTYEPSIYSVLVSPIDPSVASTIQFSVPVGQQSPPPPLYCQVPVELQGSAPAARQQLFIAPPPVPADAVQAENYARANGYAFLPTIACTPQLLSASGSPIVITAFISQPTSGQVVTAGTPITGTVQFSPSQAQYWKLELHGGQFGDNWVTMNDVQHNSVVNGQLDVIPGLQPGNYDMQLIVVGNDGNYVQTPYQVSFTVQ